MGKPTTLATGRKELAKKYGEEADEVGLSRSEYVRKCIEVGRLTFRTSGKIDVDRLRELTEGESVATNSDLKTSGSNLSEAILRNLPTDEDRALSPEELREAVFGTKSEQHEEIVKSLGQLREAGMIEVLVGDEYVKTEDYDE
jgi:hypothetical protein